MTYWLQTLSKIHLKSCILLSTYASINWHVSNEDRASHRDLSGTEWETCRGMIRSTQILNIRQERQ